MCKVADIIHHEWPLELKGKTEGVFSNPLSLLVTLQCKTSPVLKLYRSKPKCLP